MPDYPGVDPKHTFYAPAQAFSGERVTLSETEARHATRVLRLRTGQQIRIVDGQGGEYIARLVIGGNDVHATVESSERDTGPLQRITVAISPLKKPARYEFFLEKAAELGVSEIVPLICARTEKQRIRRDRFQTILISAMKQSCRSFLPGLHDPVTFSRFVGSSDHEHKLVCHENASHPVPSAEAIGAGKIAILIGPEGGFTQSEIDEALVCGFESVSLGSYRLRAETAGIAVLAHLTLGRLTEHSL